MKRIRFTEEQIIGVLKQAESGVWTADLCRQHGINKNTLYNWRKKFGGMEVSDAKKMHQLEDENRRLKRVVADLTLDNVMLKDVLLKNGRARRATASGGPSRSQTWSQPASRMPCHESASFDAPLSVGERRRFSFKSEIA